MQTLGLLRPVIVAGFDGLAGTHSALRHRSCEFEVGSMMLLRDAMSVRELVQIRKPDSQLICNFGSSGLNAAIPV